ncbi:DNA-binding transcriptional regulator [Acuticoccus sediminis]|uniref:DNA-binding transcriptional regulator n=1 Tax=Acuticoccus sediminis TaxID=2184697 RepID=A0A8B2NX00_9HYPH|nr:sugar-binding transcriptional regulator [Acuticoccus sediminis]RAI02333.1 DNA-binding transcriptional regulator [Acuticoccus sediminis]
MTSDSPQPDRRIDLAARAGWLYYVAGYRQDGIAEHLGVSRQTAQRLVALAVEEKLVNVRVDHPISRCMELAGTLRSRYGLCACEVVPSPPNAPDAITGLGAAGAAVMERELKVAEPRILAVGTGRALRSCVEELSPMSCPQHRIVALLSHVGADGSASRYNVGERMAERVDAALYPAWLPIYSRSAEDREMLQRLDFVKRHVALARRAAVRFVGIGSIGADAAMLADGFLSADEVASLQAAGGVGEITGFVFDREGALLPAGANARVNSVPLAGTGVPVYGVAAGRSKVAAIRGALLGRLITGLVTNERTAESLLR